MVYAFLVLWAFGAVLALACTALAWSERMSVLRTLPTCAECGYDLVGLARSSKCPECGGTRRRFSAGVKVGVSPVRSILLWAAPTIAGLVVSGGVAVWARITAPDNVLGTLACALPFACMGGLLRIMLRWMTMSAAWTMMWCGVTSLSIALIGVMGDALLAENLASSPLETWRIAPLMIAPFAGYGLAGGIAVLAWQRSRPARAE